MSKEIQIDSINQREDIRVAGDGHFDLTVINAFGQSVEILRDAQILNISAGGMEFLNVSLVKPQTWLSLQHQKETLMQKKAKIVFEVVASNGDDNGQHKVHCRLIEGTIPAKLMFGW